MPLCINKFYLRVLGFMNFDKFPEKRCQQLLIRSLKKILNLLFSKTCKDFKPEERLFRIDLIAFPEIEIEDVHHLFDRRKLDKVQGIPLPYFLNGQKDLH